MDLKKSVGFPALFFVYITKKSMQTVLKNLEGFYIIKKEIDNAKFPKLTNRVHYLKHEEGGVQKMCEVMEQYSKKAVKKATKQANITAIKNMLEFKIPQESILKKYTESEYNTAIAELQSESR